jgi:serine/threonine protein kinase/Tol biopolymer transport system component
MEDPRTPASGPTTISRYRIVEKLGAGGNGVVYKAEDTRLGRFVALKFLPPEGRHDAHAQARFQREAQAASTLNHHNICTVYDIGEQDGQTFIAMELLEGQTLKQKIGPPPLPLETLLDYAMQIAAGLEIAHKNGIVHRDVKPSNIFVTSRGEVKLADFGLAKRVMLDSTPSSESPTVSASITERGVIVGTVAYMSPEQAQDQDIDARSDIFSFGIVLYEMATGKRAFPGESSVTIIGAILHKEPKAIRELNPQVPEELQRIVVKTLEKDREDRYQTAHELMVDLRRLMKKETERSQSGLAAEATKQEKSRKWMWIGAAAMVVCAAAWIALSGRGTPADAAPLAMEQLTFSSETKNPAIFTDGSRIYFVSDANPVEMSVKGGATAPLRAAIGSKIILDISPDGSEFLLLQGDLNDETQRGTIWTMPVLGGAAKRLGNITARGASYSPDGKLIAFNEKESVYVCDSEGQDVKEVWNTHHMVPGNPAFSPDSKKLRVTVSRSNLEDDVMRIWEVNVDGSNPHVLPLPPHWPNDTRTYSGIWTPGGKHFVFGSYRDRANNLYEYIEPRWYEFWHKPYAVQLTPGQPEVAAMAPSRDGNGMFVVGRLAQGSLHFYDEKEKRFLPYLGGIPAAQLVVSPDRKWMVYTDYPRGYLWRCKLDGSEKLQLTDTLAQMPTWSPDGKWIAYSDWNELYRVSVDSGAPEKLTSEGFMEVLPSWSPDGMSIYFNDYPIAGHFRIRVLDLKTRKVSTMPGSDGYYAPLWSPDGQYLAGIHNPPKSLAIYSVKTKQWKQLKVFQRDWGFFVWAPDSKSLYSALDPTVVATGEQTGVYRLTVPDGKWELFTKFTGINVQLQGAQDFISFTPEGNIAVMSDTSATQIYQMKWKHAE